MGMNKSEFSDEQFLPGILKILFFEEISELDL